MLFDYYEYKILHDTLMVWPHKIYLHSHWRMVEMQKGIKAIMCMYFARYSLFLHFHLWKINRLPTLYYCSKYSVRWKFLFFRAMYPLSILYIKRERKRRKCIFLTQQIFYIILCAVLLYTRNNNEIYKNVSCQIVNYIKQAITVTFSLFHKNLEYNITIVVHFSVRSYYKVSLQQNPFII